MGQTLPSKEAVVLKLLEEGDTMLCLDARHEGVAVPRKHVQNPALRLILNLNFPRPIEVTAEGVSAHLSFGGRRFHCYIPMDALWAAFNPQTMQGMMWPENMPPEVQAEMATPQGQDTFTAPSVPTAAKQTTPRAITGKGKHNRDEQTKDPSAPRQRGHLRVVK